LNTTAPDGRSIPQQTRSRERYQRILVAAGNLYYERGYDSVTTNNIADAAGVPIGSVYRYFSTKENILEALADYFCHSAERLVAQMLGRWPIRHLSQADIARLLVIYLLQFCRDNPVAAQLLIAEVHPVFMRVGQPIRRVFIKAFEQILAVGLDPSRDSVLVASISFDALRSIVWQILQAPPEIQGQLVSEAIQFVERFIS
jgi:AcrR family transcriptional regulator